MPGRTKKRKPKRRKPFSRKRARRRRRRPASRPLVNTPSSDEDFVLDGDAEGSSSGSEDSDEQEDSEEVEEEEEEEESEDQLGNEVQNFDPNGAISRHRRRNPSRASNGLANATSLLSQDSSDEDFIADIERASGSARDRSAANRQSAPSRPRRHQRHRVNELDEDFDNDLQRSLEDNGIGREALPSAHASGSRHRRARQNLSDEDFDIETERVLEVTGTGGHANHASHPARVRRRHRRQESSDEDFEVDMERILESSFIANGGAFASRPVTRAMDSFLVSDLHDGGPGKFPSDSEARGVTENSAAQEPSPQEAHTNFGKRGGSVVNDTESDKRKGKEKVLEGEESTSSLFASETLLSNVKASNADEETSAVVCGICWTEMVVAERGKLDSCDHFFCFGCIMEWAKVESRCPMCKQRFTTIARSGTGKSKRIRTIRIPLRDQVYIPPEDPDLPPEDPYADIVCMECHGTGDEGLLLLCDHCDSAAHTFCVGLGRSVPRGDWYCRECQALIGGISGSEDEAEELVSGSGEEEEDDDDDLEDDDTESILRAIVASVNPASQRTRQTRVQRRSTSTSRSVSLSRNGRARFWQRLSRRQRGRYIAAPRPRLSQAARALLSSTAAELDQAPRTSEAPQNGQARTVPQQRRLHERINEMRNNWGRIQNGDLQFDALRAGATRAIRPVLSNSNGEALRTGATGPVQLAVASNSNVAPIPTTPSLRASASDKRDVDSVEQPESSTQRDKDLQRAWQMMSHAQHLSDGIGSSKSHQQKLGVSPSSSTLVGARQPTKNTTSSATSDLPFARTNLEIPSCIVPSPPLENGNAGLYEPGSTPLQVFSNLKHDEIPLRQVSRPTASLAMTSVSGECRKEELPCPSNSQQSLGACTTTTGFDKDSCRPAGGKHTVSLQGFKPEPSKSSRHFERKDAGILQNLPENMRSKDSQGVSGAKEKIDARSSTLPPHEGLKVHLTELVKKQTWHVYLAERLDKEQFKRIARTAVHSLLALCDPNNKSMSLSCVHFEDLGNDPVVKCCKKCLDQHVEKAVKIAKDKIIPS